MWGRLTRTVAPTEQPVTIADAKRQCRVTSSSEDEFIGELIEAATAAIDGPNGIGLAMITQTWQLVLDGFPAEIELPLYPVQSIVSISYTDADGNLNQLLDPALYELNKYATRAIISPAYNVTWPSVLAGRNRVGVTFRAGYGLAPAVPPDLKRAILLLVGHWYNHREAVVIGQAGQALPHAVESILARYRVGTVY